MMITQYLLDAGHPIEVPGVEAPQSSFADTVAPVQLALEQEKRVSDQIANLARAGARGGRLPGEQFMQWFIKEQVEEVSSMSALLKIVERAKDNPLMAEEYLARENVGGQRRRSDCADGCRRRPLGQPAGSLAHAGQAAVLGYVLAQGRWGGGG